MSKYIATRAIRGANALVTEAEVMLNKALVEKGPDTPVSFPNTAYFLPTILGMTGKSIEKIGDLKPVMDYTRGLLHPVPAGKHWTPYLGETLDSGMATLLAAETIEAVRFVYGLQPEPMPESFTLAGGTAYGGANGNGHLNGPIDDIQLRSWGIQLVDGRMPGFAAIVGCAKSNEVAVKIVRELQRRNILTFLSGNVNGRSIIDQLHEEGVELGYDTYTVPFGRDTISAIYALGFATRSALTFGGLKPGMSREILLYNKDRVFAFVLASAKWTISNTRPPRARSTLVSPSSPTRSSPKSSRPASPPMSTSSPCRSTRLTARTILKKPSASSRNASRCAASRSRFRTWMYPSRTAPLSKAKSSARLTCAWNSAARRAALTNICTWRSWTRSPTARSM